MTYRKLNRKKYFDYSSSGYYFVTICTKGRLTYFGYIDNNKMILNGIGQIIEKYWLEIPKHFSDISIDEYAVMPNHVHGIVIINDEDNNVGNRHACSLQSSSEGTTINRIKRQHQKLPVVIGSFKAAATKYIRHNLDISFSWQKSYFDRIIRNEIELNKIRQYIVDNPLNWDKDENNLLNL